MERLAATMPAAVPPPAVGRRREEFRLCRQFLLLVLDDTLDGLDEDDPVLRRLRRWLGQLEESEPGSADGPDGAHEPEGWSALFSRLGIDLFERLENLVGSALARNLYEEGYRRMADRFLELESFPVVARLFPPDQLDEAKLALLSREQTRRVLLDRLDDQTAANRELRERQAEMEMAIEVLEKQNQDLERRVRERTADLEHANLLKDRMREAQRLESLGVLTGGIAHEFNNLLTTIIGHVGLMESALPPSHDQGESLDALRGAASRAGKLTQQMLAFSGGGRFVVGPVDLRDLVQEIREILELSLPGGAALQFRFAGELPAVEGDAAQLRQVVMNLVSNAADALSELYAGAEHDGEVYLRLYETEIDRALLEASRLGAERRVGRYVCLEVEDDACGMDEETLAKIFEPFFTTRFLGRGLGLAATLGIVRAHDGAIHVESEAGKGTRVRVFLPPSDAADR